MVVYSVYLFDRVITGAEDEINRGHLKTSMKTPAILVSITAFSLGTFLSGFTLACFVPYLIGFAYSRGIHAGNLTLRLKGGRGVKNIVVALTWGATIVLFMRAWTKSPATLAVIFIFFFTKSFINTIIYDFRDIDGDSKAGIQTLPIYIGESKTRLLLQTLNVLIHLFLLIMMVLGIANPEYLILLTCFICGVVYTTFLARKDIGNSHRTKILRDAIVDGEFILAVIFREILSSSTFLGSTQTALSPREVQSC
jgi:4-hydroxybenzoate polyprenyltransferase